VVQLRQVVVKLKFIPSYLYIILGIHYILTFVFKYKCYSAHMLSLISLGELTVPSSVMGLYYGDPTFNSIPLRTQNMKGSSPIRSSVT